jgi:hypothetical protein
MEIARDFVAPDPQNSHQNSTATSLVQKKLKIFDECSTFVSDEWYFAGNWSLFIDLLYRRYSTTKKRPETSITQKNLSQIVCRYISIGLQLQVLGQDEGISSLYWAYFVGNC